MPPAKPKPPKPPLSNSRDLVPIGPREVFAKNGARRDENGNKPLTARALVLRNGKYGARGTGELMHLGTMSGREKLDLLAEDLIEHSKTALGTPFRLEKCLDIADAQLAANLDEIANLQDPELFHVKIKAEINARTPKTPGRSSSDPLYVASIVASRLHNTYMMASAWKIIGDTLRSLARAGVQDGLIRNQLQRDPNLLSQFLVLYDVVNVVTQAAQAKFALLATTAPQFSQYFKTLEDADTGEPEYVFDYLDGLKHVHKSFIDSIVVELCLPQSAIPRQVLYQILHEAIEETPREAKRFPQAVWDAVGDLSDIVQLQDFLENPLLGPEGAEWKKLPRHMPEAYENWIDAQIFSEKASKLHANYKDIIHPLERTKNSHVLDNMWKFVNLNYTSVSGKDIDTLWQLSDVMHLTPQWHASYVPAAKNNDSDDDMPGLLPVKGRARPGGSKARPGKLLAITNGNASDSDGSMPSLQTVSDSDDDDDSDDSDDDRHEERDDDSNDFESGYDTDEEDALRDMLREAMDTAMAVPDFFDPRSQAPEFNELAEERKGNPFLKLLGSLRGRMFSSNPTLKTTQRKEPRRPFAARKPPTAPPPTSQPSSPTAKPLPTPTTAPQRSHKPTVEIVEDEDEAPATSGKKKKKKPKKKKKSVDTASTDVQQLQTSETATVQTPSTPTVPPQSSPPTAATPQRNGPSSPQTTKVMPTRQSPSKPRRPASMTSSMSTLPGMSTTSLPIPQTAQSAHKYMQTENLAAKIKEKVKSRRDPGDLEAIQEKKGFFSRFTKQAKEQDQEPVKEGSKFSYFSRLSKKTATYMHQLLGTSEDEKKGLASMKWEHFLKVMREMGFSYDPSTAGSSVRFTPPDDRDRPITFHKPHPDPTLQPFKLKEYGRRLKRCYGWSESDFYKATA